MNKLTLLELSLKNFKGIKSFTFKPDGEDSEIAGKNATGKTTIFDGLTWLFFGKDSSGKSDFQLKPVDKKGNDIHNLDTEIEGVISLDGSEYSLKKRFIEKWTKKQGTATKEFTGHTTKHFIDEVPKSKAEYESFISDIVDPKIFKLVTDPLSFNGLHWQERRKIVIEMCGDVPDEEIISSDKKLAGLTKILKDCSIEDNKKKIASQKREINKELTLIPARIDEVHNSIQEIERPDQAEKKKTLDALEKAEEELRKLKSNETLSEKRVELSTIKNDILKAKSKSYDSNEEALKPLRDEKQKLSEKRNKHASDMLDFETIIKTCKDRNSKREEALKNLREEWHKIDSKTTEARKECPACGQDLPEDEIEAAIEKFNDSKAEKLKANVEEGKRLKQSFDETIKEIEELKGGLKDRTEKESELHKAIIAKEEEISKAIKSTGESVDTTELDSKKETVEAEIKELEKGSEEQEKGIQTSINTHKIIIAEYDKVDAEIKASEKAVKRIAELEEQEKTLSEEFEKLEATLFLIDEFIVKKVESLEDKINSKFKMARFKMFEMQINSGINEMCEVMYEGVEFNKGLNAGARIQVGIDIINTISEHYGFQAVIFVDNRESVTSLPDSESQIISLTVDASAKKLTVT